MSRYLIATVCFLQVHGPSAQDFEAHGLLPKASLDAAFGDVADCDSASQGQCDNKGESTLGRKIIATFETMKTYENYIKLLLYIGLWFCFSSEDMYLPFYHYNPTTKANNVSMAQVKKICQYLGNHWYVVGQRALH